MWLRRSGQIDGKVCERETGKNEEWNRTKIREPRQGWKEVKEVGLKLNQLRENPWNIRTKDYTKTENELNEQI